MPEPLQKLKGVRGSGVHLVVDYVPPLIYYGSESLTVICRIENAEDSSRIVEVTAEKLGEDGKRVGEPVVRRYKIDEASHARFEHAFRPGYWKRVRIVLRAGGKIIGEKVIRAVDPDDAFPKGLRAEGRILRDGTGETVVLKIPASTQPGDRLRVRNQGLPRADGYGRGNLIVQVQVEVPKKLTVEQRELLEQFDSLEERKPKSASK